MSNEASTTTSTTFSAPTIEEAIDIGLKTLGVKKENIEIEVVDEGARGLFGLGGRDAVVRLNAKEGFTTSQSAAGELEQVVTVQAIEDSDPVSGIDDQPEQSWSDEEIDEEEATELSTARETVSELLEKMGVVAQVEAHSSPSEDENRKPIITVEISGDDLSILIGRRAETLNALQFITRLIVGKELGRSVPLIVDVQKYRERRERELRRLARRMADQAVQTGKRQVLEPMPANERRFIHVELRDHPDVTTESIGDGNRRKVTILPRK